MRLALGLWIFTVNSRHSPRKVESAYSKDGDSICEMSMTVTSVLFIHGAVQARVRSTLIHIKSKSDNLMFPKVSFAAYPYFSFLFFFSFPELKQFCYFTFVIYFSLSHFPRKITPKK